jgi:glucosamine-6-phosphate deaminase
MRTVILNSKSETGKSAAEHGGRIIIDAVQEKGTANIILATGISQFEMLEELVKNKNIDWTKVSCFHLDEYVGLPKSHPSSFDKYFKKRFLSKVSVKDFYFINGEANIAEECKRLGDLIRKHPADLVFLGIGMNGHLAFNDPPADFDTDEAYIEVELDEVCRDQQFKEGWFDSLKEVPEKALSMSIRQIMKSKSIICLCPDQRKEKIVQKCVEGEVTNMVPASILQKHDSACLYLDEDSAKLLNKNS